MRFKVGDKVRVREWDDMAKEFPPSGDAEISFGKDYCFIKSMSSFCGKIAKIINVRITFYDIDLDERKFGWTDEMLLPAEGADEAVASGVEGTV